MTSLSAMVNNFYKQTFNRPLWGHTNSDDWLFFSLNGSLNSQNGYSMQYSNIYA